MSMIRKYRMGFRFSQVTHQVGAYPSFSSMKRLGILHFLLPPGWHAGPSQGYPPSIKFASTRLYTWVERGTVRVKCLAQEHNTMSPARTLAPESSALNRRPPHPTEWGLTYNTNYKTEVCS